MSLITLEQFDEFVEAYPEMEQCYGSLLDMHYDHEDGMDWDAYDHNLTLISDSLGITTDELIDMELNGEIEYAA